MFETISKETKHFKKAEIKKIDNKIKANQNQLILLKLEKQKWERLKINQFAEIKKLNKTIRINEIYQLQKEIEKNKEVIAKLANNMANKPLPPTYMIEKSQKRIVVLNEEIAAQITASEKLDDEIRIMEIEGTALEQQTMEANAHDLVKKLALSKLKLRTAKLAVKLESKTYKTKKIFVQISNNKLQIASKYLLIKLASWEFSPTIMTEKEILNARLNVRLKLKITNMCDLNLEISKSNLKIAKIDKKLAKLNVNINRKNIKIKNYLQTIKRVYNSQSIKIQIKIFLMTPFMWLNKHFQAYKYELMLNQYQNHLAKLEREIVRLEATKSGGYFYDKFWFIISCGRYDKNSTVAIKAQKKAKLYEIKQKIYDLKKQMNGQSQATIKTNLVAWDKATLQLERNGSFSEDNYQTDKGVTTAF